MAILRNEKSPKLVLKRGVLKRSRINEPQVFLKLIYDLTKDDVGFLVIFMNKNLIKRLKHLNLSGKILFKVFNCRSKLIIVEFYVLKLRSYRFTRRRIII
jgi:hypothetical protein